MKDKNSIAEWVESRKWGKKVKAVCKPCWEIKYCPYGSLVEKFPIADFSDEKRCIIFGHQCPVFSVAEPFTETKELRNITREIPRVTQFRVLKRENQICSDCGNSVKDGNIEFDHVIPWSKGGSSDENNVRLLCMKCNRKKGKKFKEQYLIENYNDHFSQPNTENIICLLLIISSFGNEFIKENNEIPKAQNFADGLANGELTDAEKMASNYFQELSSFFNNKKPTELTAKQFDALKFRWGFKDAFVYKMKETLKLRQISIDDYFIAEQNLVRRLGFRMSLTKTVIDKWKKL